MIHMLPNRDILLGEYVAKKQRPVSRAKVENSVLNMGVDHASYKHLIGACERLPKELSTFVNKNYRRDRKKRGEYVANRAIAAINSKLDALGVSLNMSPDNVEQVAKFRADHVVNRYRLGMTHTNVCTYVESLGVEIPAGDDLPVSNRLKCAEWWQRTLHRLIDRCREDIARAFGVVNKANDVYISSDSMKRIKARWERSEKIMNELKAICQETGEELGMSEILEGSMSNPKNRFAELMVRIRGFEDYAKEKNHKAVFYTLTCPSKFHAFGVGGFRNAKFQDKTVREGQQYMVKVWSQARAKLDRLGVGRYGFRVVEPHHDGTPHWHLLLFIPAEQVELVNAVISDYFKREDNEELFNKIGMPLEKKHKARVDIKHIDFSRGSAVGYLIKYIAKNIGCMSGSDTEDYETGFDAAESAPLVRGWASVHGIRQFQQLGGASVTAWREFRKLREVSEDNKRILNLWKMADTANWSGFCKLLGGCEVKRKHQPISLKKAFYLNAETGEVKTTRYGDSFEVVTGVVVGFMCHVDFGSITTKVKTWVIGRSKEELETCSPWTRVNNCTVGF